MRENISKNVCLENALKAQMFKATTRPEEMTNEELTLHEREKIIIFRDGMTKYNKIDTLLITLVLIRTAGLSELDVPFSRMENVVRKTFDMIPKLSLKEVASYSPLETLEGLEAREYICREQLDMIYEELNVI